MNALSPLAKAGIFCYNRSMELVLFCDYGLDDAAATADALMHLYEDGYSGATLVAVGGNVPAEVALRNAKKLAAALSCPLGGVRIADTTMFPQPSEYLTAVHGKDGMGDLFAEAPCPVPVVPFAEWLREEEPFDLLSLGPMTLVPRALAKAPRKFVFMGGNVAEKPNFRGYEFNHALNRAAFSECVKYPHVAVTMDTCRHPLFNIQEKAAPREGLLYRIAERCRALTLTSGERGCYLWDDIAVKALRHPSWFSSEQARDKDGNLLSVAHYRYGKQYYEILEE